jgi:hypothetical protein
MSGRMQKSKRVVQVNNAVTFSDSKYLPYLSGGIAIIFLVVLGIFRFNGWV